MDSEYVKNLPVAPDFANLSRDIAVQGPSFALFTPEDALEIDALGSVASLTLTISGTVLGDRLEVRPFCFTMTVTSNRVVTTSRTSIGSGWLQSVRVTASAGTPILGQCFVWVRKCRGLTSVALVLATLQAGYVTASTDVYWPGNAAQQPLDGEGAVRSVQVTNPGAGADWSTSVPTGARWELIALVAQLVTAVAVGTREARLVIDDGANTLFEVPAAASQAPSLTVLYSWGQGAGGPIVADTAVIEAPIANDVYLTGGFRIRTATGVIQAADQWSLISLLVREWMEGN